MSGNGTAETSEKTNGSGTAAPADAACSAVLNITVNKGFRISRNPMRNQRAESGERALDKALAEFRPGGGRRRCDAQEKMRRAGEDFRAKAERRRTENGRGACAAKKCLCTAHHQKHDPNPSEIILG